MWIIVLLIIAVMALKVSTKYAKEVKKAQRKQKYAPKPKVETTPKPTAETTQKPETPEARDYSRSYQRKYLLTPNEYHAYKQLKTILNKYEMIICPKVRLLDIIEPINGDHYKGALGKIQSKHVDFVVCDKNLYVKGILELDDNSHNLPERQERDKFVDEVLRNVGYKVVRVRAVTEETIKELLPITE